MSCNMPPGRSYRFWLQILFDAGGGTAIFGSNLIYRVGKLLLFCAVCSMCELRLNAGNLNPGVYYYETVVALY